MKVASVKKWATTVLQIVVTVGAIAYLFHTIPVSEVIRTAKFMPTVSIFVLIFLVVVSELTTSIALHQLCKPHSSHPFLTTLKVDSLDFIANSIIPSRAGTLVSAPILLNRYADISNARGLSIKMTHMLIFSLINGVIGFVGLVVFFERLSLYLVLTLSAGVILYLGLAALILTKRHTYVIDSWLSHLPANLNLEVGDASYDGVLSAGILTVIAVIGITTIRFGIILTSLDTQLPIIYYTVIPIMAYAVSAIPISIGGIGITETSGIAVLTAVGLPIDIATTIVVIDRIFAAYLPLVIMYSFATLITTRERISVA